MKKTVYSFMLSLSLIILSGFMLTACSSGGEPPVTEPPMPSETALDPGLQPSPTETSTAEPEISDTPTPQPTPTLAPTPIVWPPPGMSPVAFYREDGANSLWLASVDPGDAWEFEIFRSQEQDFSWIDHISWSPDGTSFVFSTGSYPEIYRIDADGSGFANLTNDREAFDMDPAWSPDGSMIAFVSDRDVAEEHGQPLYLSVYTMLPDGSGLVKRFDCEMHCRNLSWDPTGTTLVYDDWDGSDIYKSRLDGSGLANLTGQVGINHRPLWSPDGSLIAYIFRKSLETDGFLYVMAPDGKDKRLIEGTEGVRSFSWSPDGRFIVYYALAGTGNHQLYIIHLASGTQFNLAGGLHPSWSPAMEVMDEMPGETSAGCAAGWTRLAVGEYARVTPGEPNSVRSEPGKSGNLIAKIPAGALVWILDGPVCADGYVFWKVEHITIPGGYGWTAEGDGVEYWLEPYKP